MAGGDPGSFVTQQKMNEKVKANTKETKDARDKMEKTLELALGSKVVREVIENVWNVKTIKDKDK
jgi:hypothetical protein